MPYVAVGYLTNLKALLGKWVCTRTSRGTPHDQVPPANTHGSPGFCGQCVSYVTTVCTTIPVGTALWKKGALVKGNSTIAAGTAIATFDSNGRYSGHAAIYESQTPVGLNVVDQWVTPPARPINQRMLKFGAHGNANNGNNFYIID